MLPPSSSSSGLNPPDKLAPQPLPSQHPLSPPATTSSSASSSTNQSDAQLQQQQQHADKNKSARPIISASRRTAATTRSFSSLSSPHAVAAAPGSGSSSGSASGSRSRATGSTLLSPSHLAPPPTLAIIAPTPEASPITPSTPSKRVHHKSVPETPSSVLRNPGFGSQGQGLTAPPMQKSYSAGSTAGKRKAEDVEGEPGNITPPKSKATFAPEPRTHRGSSASNAPSSYRRKRARLSLPSDGSNPPSRPNTAMSSVAESPNAKTTGSWSSKKSARGSVSDLRRQGSHVRNDSSQGHGGGPSISNASHTYSASHPYNHTPSRRSLSQASIPLSALISPHAPSVTHSGRFHMRDPRKPAPIQSTPWSLSFPSRVEEGENRWEFRSWVERGGSPLHAWFFFVGFVVFPVWWAASFVGVPQTRRLGEGEGGVQEKGVVLDDPQDEYDRGGEDVVSWPVSRSSPISHSSFSSSSSLDDVVDKRR